MTIHTQNLLLLSVECLVFKDPDVVLYQVGYKMLPVFWGERLKYITSGWYLMANKKVHL